MRLRNIILMCVCLGLPAAPVMSTPLAGWFENNEQRGKRLFDQGRFDESADSFQDDYRRGVALYSAGDYQSAAKAFEKVEREEVLQDARYNLIIHIVPLLQLLHYANEPICPFS